MLTTTDRSHLNQFCTRTAAIGDGVYVVAKRGKNAARLEQLFRVDPPGEDGFDPGQLAHELTSRLAGNPSELPTWLWCCRAGTADKLDTVRLEPTVTTDPDLQDSQSMGHLTHALTAMTRETMMANTQFAVNSQAALERLQDRYDELHERYIHAVEESATLRALDHVNATTADVLDEEPDEREDRMAQAWDMVMPLFQAAVAGTTRKMLTGPTQGANASGNRAAPTTDEAEAIATLQKWGPDQAASLAATMTLVAQHRPDLLSEGVMAEIDAALEAAAQSDQPDDTMGEGSDDVDQAADDAAVYNEVVDSVVDLLGTLRTDAPDVLERRRGDVARALGSVVAVDGEETTADQVAGADTPVAWTPERVDRVVDQVADIATNHPELITRAHLERLMEPLREPVVAMLFA